MNVNRQIALAEAGLTHEIIGAFFEVYNCLGYGFLESVYVAALVKEFQERGLLVEREVDVRVCYKGADIARHRVDLLVGKRVIIEVKAGQSMHPTAQRQLHNYLRATDLEVGLVLHFGPKPQFSREYSANRSATSHQPYPPV